MLVLDMPRDQCFEIGIRVRPNRLTLWLRYYEIGVTLAQQRKEAIRAPVNGYQLLHAHLSPAVLKRVFPIQDEATALPCLVSVILFEGDSCLEDLRSPVTVKKIENCQKASS